MGVFCEYRSNKVTVHDFPVSILSLLSYLILFLTTTVLKKKKLRDSHNRLSNPVTRPVTCLEFW